MLGLEAVTEALRGKLARRIAGQAEGFGNRRPKQRIAERVQHQRQGALGDLLRIVPVGELGDEAADRFEDRISASRLPVMIIQAASAPAPSRLKASKH